MSSFGLRNLPIEIVCNLIYKLLTQFVRSLVRLFVVSFEAGRMTLDERKKGWGANNVCGSEFRLAFKYAKSTDPCCMSEWVASNG